ncbi:hypothetical protein TWF106_007288 [Orbilia oligospora]|uniref:Uncharacterized protein n=1 Tax=Orbilia oligospora TaxID=2813651 RepID=A0A7C8QLW8_ORBOL|nr:hypothetical protein TWF106_007288 [Orbilia oligospora]
MESEPFTGSWTDEQTAEASEKVLRRAKVSRMARQLQSRLALASYKTQRGWENLDLDTIEPRVDQDLMRKRMQSIQEGSPPHLHLTNGSTNNHYDDNNDLNDYEHQPIFHSSPPRTPPHRTIPARPVFTTAGEKLEERSNRGNNNPNNPNGNNNNGGKADGEGADLLLYLATSPSPNTMTKANVSVAPSTPPAKGSAAALPSSMMNTPGGGAGLGGSGSFNFHDFVHITPSPAQGLWGNGGSGRTPMTMQARRRLNFDGLVPPSPMNGSQGSQGSQGKVTGLGMELGGELVSPTSGL